MTQAIAQALTRLGEALLPYWRSQRPADYGRVYWTFQASYQHLDTPTFSIPQRSGHSAHETLALMDAHHALQDAWVGWTQSLLTLPLLAVNKVRPALLLELVGNATHDPLSTPRAIQFTAGLYTKKRSALFRNQQTPLAQKDHQPFHAWAADLCTRLETLAHHQATPTSPIWLVSTLHDNTYKDLPTIGATSKHWMLQAETEAGARALFPLLDATHHKGLLAFSRPYEESMRPYLPWNE